jgi:hypothetical protein
MCGVLLIARAFPIEAFVLSRLIELWEFNRAFFADRSLWGGLAMRSTLFFGSGTLLHLASGWMRAETTRGVDTGPP